MPYPATPKTWVAGDVLTAAQLNAELRDALLAAFPLGVDAWTAYTPTLTQSAAVTKTVTYAKYQRIGRLVVAQVSLAVTGTGVAGNGVIVGLPVTAATATALPVGVGHIYDLSANLVYCGVAALVSTTTVAFRATDSTNASLLGAGTFTVGLAAGDEVTYGITYEAAS